MTWKLKGRQESTYSKTTGWLVQGYWILSMFRGRRHGAGAGPCIALRELMVWWAGSPSGQSSGERGLVTDVVSHGMDTQFWLNQCKQLIWRRASLFFGLEWLLKRTINSMSDRHLDHRSMRLTMRFDFHTEICRRSLMATSVQVDVSEGPHHTDREGGPICGSFFSMWSQQSFPPIRQKWPVGLYLTENSFILRLGNLMLAPVLFTCESNIVLKWNDV